MRLLKGFALAWNMLSILPFFKVHDFFKGINGYSAMFYPLVGFILGTILFATHFYLKAYLPAPHLAIIIFALWVLLTGALHLDGLSDTIDGLFVPKERALEVMKDAHVGGMGMLFSLVFLLLKASSVLYMNSYYLLPVILMLSRLNSVLALYIFPYASSGVGALLKKELGLKQLIFALAYSLGIAYLFSSLILFFFSFFSLLLVAKPFTSRLGGLSGDIYGFIIEVTELVLLNYLIISNFS